MRYISKRKDGIMNIKLKSCPFCGADAAKISDAKELQKCSNSFTCDSLYSAPVKCSYICVVCDIHDGGCGAAGGFCISEQKAAEAWNKRA